LYSLENAKSDVAKAGPNARDIDAVVWPRPLIAPRRFLVGAEAVTNTKTVPGIDWLIVMMTGSS
jgi:hypothetical protein